MVWTGTEHSEYLGHYGAKAAGDLNGDGVDDFIISGRKLTYIYYGGSNPQNKPDITLSPPVSSRDLYAWNIVGNFDFNNDGHPDVAASLRSTYVTEHVLFYFGGHAMDDKPDRVFSNGKLDEGLGRILPGGADVTGDGIDDLLVVAPYADDYVGKVYLFAGVTVVKSIQFYNPTPKTLCNMLQIP